ncbi:MAG: NmrA family transcriptional regulator, partial [Pseudomonadales bacterium]|nr:NmrA family transcriptional regulator [Pseudomonadales bacterium]
MQAQKTENQDQALTLVIGGTGKTGRRIVERLQAKGVPIRVGSRSTTPAFDWNNESSWAPALEGVQSVYISYASDLAVPGAT